MSETIEVSLRGLPEWLIREYLRELGATGTDDAAEMAAAGWSVRWSHRKVGIAGSGLGLTQFDIVFEGDGDAVREVHDRFMRKAQRGGG